MDPKCTRIYTRSFIKKPAGEFNIMLRANKKMRKIIKITISKGNKITMADFETLIFAYLLRPIISITMLQIKDKGIPIIGIQANTNGDDVYDLKINVLSKLNSILNKRINAYNNRVLR